MRKAAAVSCMILLVIAGLVRAQLTVRGSEWVRLRSAARLILGWRVGVAGARLPDTTLFDEVDRIATGPIFLRVIEGASSMRVSREIPKKLDASLTDAEVQAINRKLADAGVQMLAYSVGSAQLRDETAARRTFEFARKLNVEILVAGR